MNQKKYMTPEYTTGEDIKEVRKLLGLTQKEFALFINSSKPTVERWEVSKQPIKGPVVLLLECLRKHPELLQELMVPEKVFPVRMWYMHDDIPCTLIDIDEAKKQIHIKNYTEHVMFRAFGKEENPDFAMYEEFLKSRCFPESRDKMKLLLRELDLPFYDPFLIIEKTEGRMAEDDFWIRIER
ncbi:MAG: type II toxin-antitoxin system MqsA family antitoxin [Lachnospiraceae bacterium]|nr:type II toxin-antitoxin system MqsA family antitoxin [Lachnospiraceae bacterium]